MNKQMSLFGRYGVVSNVFQRSRNAVVQFFGGGEDEEEEHIINAMDLQTVVPRIGDEALVVNGGYRGALSTILDKDGLNFIATIELITGPFKGRVLESISFSYISAEGNLKSKDGDGDEKQKQKQKQKNKNKKDANEEDIIVADESCRLVMEVLELGKTNGQRVCPGKKVGIHYIGKLQENGEIFDSNISKSPFIFRLGRGTVIKGWDVGIDGMVVGEKIQLVIPPVMGYRIRGAADRSIPSNSWLDFEIELMDVY